MNCNVVLAGLTPTDSTRALPGAEAIFAGAKAKSLVGGRLLTPEDVANAVLFLASPLAELVQGQTLIVDGGEGICP